MRGESVELAVQLADLGVIATDVMHEAETRLVSDQGAVGFARLGDDRAASRSGSETADDAFTD